MSACDLITSVEFRYIPESEGYRFGSDGSVWSAWKQGADSPRFPWKQLALNPAKSGHLTVRVKWNGVQKSFGVHVLIAWAFHGPCPPGLECCHKDGNPANNTPDNLYWGTRQDNVDDQFAHGVFACGERSPRATFTEDEVREIRRLYAEGDSCGQIAGMKGRSRDTIKAIVGRFTWKHVV